MEFLGDAAVGPGFKRRARLTEEAVHAGKAFPPHGASYPARGVCSTVHGGGIAAVENNVSARCHIFQGDRQPRAKDKSLLNKVCLCLETPLFPALFA